MILEFRLGQVLEYWVVCCCTYPEVPLSGTDVWEVGLDIAHQRYDDLPGSVLRSEAMLLYKLTAQRSITVKNEGAHSERVGPSLGLYRTFA
jgi:hypothetical protein